MTEDISKVTNTPQAGQVDAAGTTKPAGDGGGFNASSQVSNMAQLKDDAPEVYKAMLEGIAQQIIGKMRKAQQRYKKLMRESYPR